MQKLCFVVIYCMWFDLFYWGFNIQAAFLEAELRLIMADVDNITVTSSRHLSTLFIYYSIFISCIVL